ncbi:MAG: hypothetical protein NT077_03250 [Candidatus Taylorbacteria bacterium]|nr:hypothetical protein [Candidatus Taylorbacteria bacterium]
MKILVFDDNKINQAAARAQLGKDHDLTVVGTYDQAQELLKPQYDYKKASAALKEQFGDFSPYRSNDEAMKARYFAAAKVADEQVTTYPDFDVVLTDLLVPASEQAQGSKGLEFAGEEMPVGIFIGLLAAVKGHAKFVAVFTDSDHHSHPASACFDVFNEGECKPTLFTVGSSKVLLSNTRNWVNQFDPKDLGKALKYEECSDRTDTIRAKNWATLLEYLISAK